MSEKLRNAIYNAMWWHPLRAGSARCCPRCHKEEWEGGTGIIGDPNCVLRCVSCSWQPRPILSGDYPNDDGRLSPQDLEDILALVDRIEALLPEGGT